MKKQSVTKILKALGTNGPPQNITQKLNFVKPQTLLILNLGVSKCFSENFDRWAQILIENFKPF